MYSVLRVLEATAERDGTLAELQATVEELQTMKARCQALEADVQASKDAYSTLQGTLATMKKDAEISASRVVEIERRADDLSAELSRVHDESQTERQRQAEALAQQVKQLDALRVELATTQASAQVQQQQNEDLRRQVVESTARFTATAGERDTARQEAIEAREKVAHLQGRVEAMTTQQADLMRALALPKDDGKSEQAKKAPK